MTDLFKAHINPGQLHFMKLLGFHKVKIERAEGMFYIDQNGRKILDFFGGFGSLAFGHNHPRILEARRSFQEEKRHEIAIAFMSQYAAALAHNLAACSPGDLDMVFLGSSGSEAMEAAIKVAERAAGPKRPKIVYAENSFHGKTKGVLSITDGSALSRRVQAGRQHGPGAVRRHRGGRERLPLRSRRSASSCWRPSRAAAASSRRRPNTGRSCATLCDQYGVLWVADEVQCGYGRTGRFYAFEHYGVVPDVTALAKSLGGGKAAVGAMIARRERLHEGLWHAEDGDDPCAGHLRRHRRGLRHRDRRRSTCSTTRA